MATARHGSRRYPDGVRADRCAWGALQRGPRGVGNFRMPGIDTRGLMEGENLKSEEHEAEDRNIVIDIPEQGVFERFTEEEAARFFNEELAFYNKLAPAL